MITEKKIDLEINSLPPLVAHQKSEELIPENVDINILLNICVSFFIIYFVSPNLIDGNIFNILFSTVITSYLNLLSFLPFNIGYSQVIYTFTFDMFSLPSEIALIISTIKQLTQVIFVLIISLFHVNNLK